jgi:glutathione S-transferase
MPNLKLYHFPGACSRVTMTALEHIGCAYQDEMINLAAGEQYGAEYRAKNPRGKVPALLVDDRLLTENAAILVWLHKAYPEAKLMPEGSDDFENALILSDLVWISSVWHPYVRANMMPMRWTVGDIEPVRERGKLLIAPLIEQLDDRLQKSPFYYGTDWSIIDVYLYWCYTTAEAGQFSLTGKAGIEAHRKSIEALPAFQATLAREAAANARQPAQADDRKL